MSKPTILFCSSNETIKLMEELAAQVTAGWALAERWNYRVFQVGESFVDSLRRVVRTVDFVVLLCTPDDILRSRGEEKAAPRDNLLLELGMALNQLGPERVAVVRPVTPDIKLPTDYLGRTQAIYDPGAGTPQQYLFPAANDIKSAFEGIWRNRALAQVPEEIGTDAAILQWSSPERIIPVYRDLSAKMNWYADIEQHLRAPRAHLPSRMLYYGPGLAEHWLRQGTTNAANVAQRKAFEQSFSNILDKWIPMRTADIGVIDLGIGDFEKGHMVLEELLRRDTTKVRYFALDISFQMVVSALGLDPQSTEARTLSQLHSQGGHVVGINAPFDHLMKYQHLFSTHQNLFLLLGNTLGNEMSEVATLKDISNGMRDNDILVTEIQLIESQPYTLDELTAAIQGSKGFYAGPFLALGCKASDIDLFVRKGSEQGGTVTYEIVCRFKKRRTLQHPQFEMDVHIYGDIITYIVRKYQADVLDAFFNDAELEVREKVQSTPRTANERRFCQVVATRKRI